MRRFSHCGSSGGGPSAAAGASGAFPLRAGVLDWGGLPVAGMAAGVGVFGVVGVCRRVSGVGLDVWMTTVGSGEVTGMAAASPARSESS